MKKHGSIILILGGAVLILFMLSLINPSYVGFSTRDTGDARDTSDTRDSGGEERSIVVEAPTGVESGRDAENSRGTERSFSRGTQSVGSDGVAVDTPSAEDLYFEEMSLEEEIPPVKPECATDYQCIGKVESTKAVKCENGFCKPKCKDSNGDLGLPESLFGVNSCTDKNGKVWGNVCSEEGDGSYLLDYKCNYEGYCVPQKFACPCGTTESDLAMECEAGTCVACPGEDLDCNRASYCMSPGELAPPCIVGDTECIGEKMYGDCESIVDCVGTKECHFLNKDGVTRFGCACVIYPDDSGYCFQTPWSKDSV